MHDGKRRRLRSAAIDRSGPMAAGSCRFSSSRWAVSRHQPSRSRRHVAELAKRTCGRDHVWRRRLQLVAAERRRERPARSAPSSCRSRSPSACGPLRAGSRGARSSCGTCRRRKGRRRALGRGRPGGTSCRDSPGIRPPREPDGPRTSHPAARADRSGRGCRSGRTRRPRRDTPRAGPMPRNTVTAACRGERARVRVGGRDVPADREQPRRRAVALERLGDESPPGSPGPSPRTPGADSAAGSSRRSQHAEPARGCSR